jgi:hypothetical protein
MSLPEKNHEKANIVTPKKVASAHLGLIGRQKVPRLNLRIADQSGDLLLSLTGRAAIARWPSRVLGVKGKFLTIDLSHKLGANCYAVFKFLFGLAP